VAATVHKGKSENIALLQSGRRQSTHLSMFHSH